MFRKMAAVFLSVLLVAMMVPVPALAVGDTTPPELVSISLNKYEFTVGDTIILTLDINETESGLNVNQCSILFSEKEKHGGHLNGIVKLRQSETQENLFYGELELTENSAPTGTYVVYSVNLCDLSDNSSSFRNPSLDTNFQCTLISSLSFSFSNNVREDWKGPVFNSIQLGSTSLNTGDTLNCLIDAADPAGISLMYLGFYNKEREACFNIFFSNSGSSSLLTGSIILSSELPTGVYVISSLYMYDSLYNLTYYVSSSEVHPSLPDDLKLSVYITNPNDIPVYQEPVIKKIEISKPVIKQGEYTDVTVYIDTKDNPLIGDTAYSDGLCQYQKIAEGVYRAHVTIPVNKPAGFYPIVDFIISFRNNQYLVLHWYEPGHDCNGILSIPGEGYTYKIELISAFTGTDNITIPLGCNFDPMKGVSASNEVDGNMTGRIEVTNNVNTEKVGLYLVKYKIITDETDQFGTPLCYYDFRWVGVTELPPQPTAYDPGTLVVTDGSVVIGAESGDVTLKKDGSTIAYAGSVKDAGKYSASVAESGKTGKFVIDKTGPAIATSLIGTYPSTLTVSTSIKDPAGVAESRWMAGNVPLADIRGKGTVFAGKFTVSKFGAYTVYSKDRLGNESVKAVTLQYNKLTGISLNLKKATVLTGKTVQLAPAFSPASATFKNVTWTSSNPAVAKVGAAGLVTAVSPGTAKITARAADGGKTAVCTVTVKAPVAVSSVRISSTSKTVTVGKAFSLTASVRPTSATVKTVTWSSSNKSVVTVSAKGLVKAVGVGTAYVYAKSANGKTARCKVVVKPVAVTKVAMNKTGAKLAVGSVLQLTAKLSPSNATVKTLTWKSSNPAVATVDSSGKVKALKKGTATVYARASNGKYARCLITVP